MTDVIVEEEIRIQRERRERARVRVKMGGRRERVRGEEIGRKRQGGRERERKRIDVCIQIESHVKVSEGGHVQGERHQNVTSLARTLILDFSLQSYEEINFCCLNLWSVVLCYGSSSKEIYHCHPLTYCLFTSVDSQH